MASSPAGFAPGSVIAITGIMGAGKSTVADWLAPQLDKSAHVRGDAFRRATVRGRVEMTPDAGEEALRQLRLRYELGAAVSDRYAAAGFTVVYQDIILGDDWAALPDRITTRPLYGVVLAPPPAVALARAEGRDKESGSAAVLAHATHSRSARRQAPPVYHLLHRYRAALPLQCRAACARHYDRASSAKRPTAQRRA